MTAEAPFPWLSAFPREQGVRILAPHSAFEPLYAETRIKEERILADARVARLPDGHGLWNADEWRIRREGMHRLLHELRKHGRRLRVLEVGCGNGWLSAALANDGHTVLGIDAFTAELEQAARVFPHVAFARADLFAASLPPQQFDAVVFAASLQYFSDAAATLKRALDLTAPAGSVHVLDSVLYTDAALARMARDRSRSYYEGIGVPAMAAHYHAHLLEEVLRAGDASIIAAPLKKGIRSLLTGKAPSPFTHVLLRKPLR